LIHFREIQHNMKFYRVIPFIFWAWLGVGGTVFGAPADDQFLAARDAARSADRAKLERLAPALEDHELAAYIDYWRLLLDLKDADASTVNAFLARHENSHVAEKMRADWLRQLGKKQQWANFDAEYARLAQPDQELVCYSLQSRRAQGDKRVGDDALSLWLTLAEPPDSCYPVLEALIVDKRVLADSVWARIRRQFEANKIAAAIYSMNYLPASQMPDKKLAQVVADSPLPWLNKLPSDFSGSRMQRELAVLAIQRVARNDPRVAADQLEKIAGSLKPGEKNWAWSQIGLQAAQRHLPEAMDWYRQAGDSALSDEAAEWKVRAALRQRHPGTLRHRAPRSGDVPAVPRHPAALGW
jgi:soluble lytic murein transglycosylase